MENQFVGKMSSKDYLKYALLSLMEEKNAHNIKVSELCNKAMISRSTFYTLYKSQDRFYASLMREAAEQLRVAYFYSGKQMDFHLPRKTAYPRLYKRCLQWYQYIYDDNEFFRKFLGKNGFVEFQEMLCKNGVEAYYDAYPAERLGTDDSASVRMTFQYMVYGHMGLLHYYLDNDMKYSVEFMARRMAELTLDTLEHLPNAAGAKK